MLGLIKFAIREPRLLCKLFCAAYALEYTKAKVAKAQKEGDRLRAELARRH